MTQSSTRRAFNGNVLALAAIAIAVGAAFWVPRSSANAAREIPAPALDTGRSDGPATEVAVFAGSEEREIPVVTQFSVFGFKSGYPNWLKVEELKSAVQQCLGLPGHRWAVRGAHRPQRRIYPRRGCLPYADATHELL